MNRAKTRINDKSEIISLLKKSSLIELGLLADQKRQEQHPDSEPVTFVVDRNVNYTNVCSCKCRFCAFHRNKNDSDAYVLDYNAIKNGSGTSLTDVFSSLQLRQSIGRLHKLGGDCHLKNKIDELVSVGGTQLLLQGGLNPDLPFKYYLNLVKNIRKDFPELAIHAFSPSEIVFMGKNNDLSIKEVLQELVKNGLSSIPGGGAEILCDEIRYKLSPNKISSQQWLDVMQIAHELRLKTTATMVFGFGEDYGHIAEHLLKIRDLQDKTGGFTAFIPWTFAPTESFQGLSKNLNNTAQDYLKVLAVSRLVLDNIPNVQASWVTQGLNIAQIALRFGANDFGGTMLEENVVRAAGISNKTTVNEIIEYIQKAGFKTAQRDTYYKIIKKF